MLRLKRIWEKEKRLSNYIAEVNPRKILLIFWHGAGDAVMFLNPFEAFQKQFSDIKIDLAVQKGLGFHEITQELQETNVLFIDGNDYGEMDTSHKWDEYDIIADIDFPMNEGQTEYTKGEWCCINELGIDPVNGHKKLTCGKNRLIPIMFHITCLPNSCNPDRDTAEKIWNDVLESGFIPLEMYFTHAFSNPVNSKFDFIDATTRRCHAKISSLVGLIENSAGIISVVTGNLHISLSVLPPERIFFLEKDFKLECFTKEAHKIRRANVRDYRGEVKEWLITLQ